MKWSALAGSAALAAAAACSVIGLGAMRPASAGADPGAPGPAGLTAVEFARRLHLAGARPRHELERDPAVGAARVAVVPTPAGQPLKVVVHVRWSMEADDGRLAHAARTALEAFEGVAEVTAEATDDLGRRAAP